MDKQYSERGINLLWMKKLIFSGIFIEENKLHAIYDRYNDLSCKQWLLLVITNAFDDNPDLTKLSNAMGCSRQNVKKIALNVEKLGLITLEPSKNDKRSILVVLTSKGRETIDKIEEMSEEIHNEFFKDFTDNEIETYYKLSIKIMNGIDNLNHYFMMKTNKALKK